MKDTIFSSLGMQDSIWKLYRIDDPYIHEKTTEIKMMRRLCFETLHGGRRATLGVYEYAGKEVLKAWGYKDEEHCSYHAIKINTLWSETIEGCPDFKVLSNGFSLSYKKMCIWENHNYREEILAIGDSSNTLGTCPSVEENKLSLFKTYSPPILTSLFSLLVGCIVSAFKGFNLAAFIMNSMGVFITTIGILKLQNIQKFVAMFCQYDPLAKRSRRYAKIYPYLETILGLLLVFKLFVIPTQIVVILIYTCTTIGITYSLRKEKKLQCGCLGGGVQLPLSKVTIFENLTMILMALWSLAVM